jgi:hypothetical protein
MEETQHDYIAFLKGKMLVKLIVNFKTIKWFENNQGNNDIL